jgi:hypothetical protein
VTVPSSVLHHIAAPGGGQVVLVVGAGSSMDLPTGLKSGSAYSLAAWDKLVSDGVLAPNACNAPEDLSVLADAVFALFNSQRELTDRLPRREWRMPSPNAGHVGAAALLIEGALKHIVTLNYDLSFQIALSYLGAPDAVSVVKGPEDQASAGLRTLTYLHRSAEADPETWVLRKVTLDDGWRDGWEQGVVLAALATPVTIFAGLGSPAGVLTESVERLANSLRGEFYLFDPNPESAFAAALGNGLQEAQQLDWLDLVSALCKRVVHSQLEDLKTEIWAAADSVGADRNLCINVLAPLHRLSLVQLGAVRATWLLRHAAYSSDDSISRVQMAQLSLALGQLGMHIESGEEIEIGLNGIAHLTAGSGKKLRVLPAHGGGVATVSSIEESTIRINLTRPPSERVRHVLVSGARGTPRSTPSSLIRESDSADIVRGTEQIELLFEDELFSDDADSVARTLERVTR